MKLIASIFNHSQWYKSWSNVPYMYVKQCFSMPLVVACYTDNSLATKTKQKLLSWFEKLTIILFQLSWKCNKAIHDMKICERVSFFFVFDTCFFFYFRHQKILFGYLELIRQKKVEMRAFFFVHHKDYFTLFNAHGLMFSGDTIDTHRDSLVHCTKFEKKVDLIPMQWCVQKKK